MEVEIRLLTSADASIFDHVADEVFDEPIDPKRLTAYLAEPGHFMLVALAGNEVVAQVTAVIHRHPDKVTELYIDEVGVAPAFQRQGIARRMLDEMFAIGRARGCEEAWVGTEHDNVPARRLYESGGSEAEPFVMYVYKLLAARRASQKGR
jgi:ribosomal protein S18 acetylase RimI-like enzyme